jgi:hypothetical protein
VRFRKSGACPPIDLFGSAGPIAVLDGGEEMFLWTRPSLPSTVSGLRAHPDLLCTRGTDLSRLTDIDWIVECKHRGELTAQELRAEFGKAFDLEAPAYTIVTYEPQPDYIVTAARELGLDIRTFPLTTTLRPEYLQQRRDLGSDLADTLDASHGEKRFAQRILTKGQVLEQKSLPRPRQA